MASGTNFMTGDKVERLSGFDSLQTGKRIPRERDSILIPVGPWLQKLKNIRELCGTFFNANLVPKIAQTRVYTDPYTIFHQKQLETYTPFGFLGNLRGIRRRLTHRVYVSFITIPKTHRKVKFFTRHPLPYVKLANLNNLGCCRLLHTTETGEIVTPKRELQEQCLIFLLL